ncbi:MAG TPA: hypothetical protein PLV72_02565 [Candidatus Magasanikbacteria bacterium]|nr:hypothetical protein [Candidatus Magasanikbacteria bacterium]
MLENEFNIPEAESSSLRCQFTREVSIRDGSGTATVFNFPKAPEWNPRSYLDEDEKRQLNAVQYLNEPSEKEIEEIRRLFCKARMVYLDEYKKNILPFQKELIEQIRHMSLAGLGQLWFIKDKRQRIVDIRRAHECMFNFGDRYGDPAPTSRGVQIGIYESDFDSQKLIDYKQNYEDLPNFIAESENDEAVIAGSCLVGVDTISEYERLAGNIPEETLLIGKHWFEEEVRKTESVNKKEHYSRTPHSITPPPRFSVRSFFVESKDQSVDSDGQELISFLDLCLAEHWFHGYSMGSPGYTAGRAHDSMTEFELSELFNLEKINRGSFANIFKEWCINTKLDLKLFKGCKLKLGYDTDRGKAYFLLEDGYFYLVEFKQGDCAGGETIDVLGRVSGISVDNNLQELMSFFRSGKPKIEKLDEEQLDELTEWLSDYLE